VARPEYAPNRPFCTQRCQLIDLHHWFEGDYRISDPLAADADTPPSNGPGPQDTADDAR
jgi:endogenous inhibitor of DNA gyrase (YacG/DUF329 family)